MIRSRENGNGVADGGRWTGPASGYFLDSTSEMTRESTAVADRAGKYARALITFASALRSVNQTMDQALEKARSGGLRIEGPIIFAPEAPKAPEPLPTGPCGTPKAQRIMEQNQTAQQEFANGPLAEYNRKAGIFNACKMIVKRARNTEKAAHEELKEQLTDEGGETVDPAKTTVTLASYTRDMLGSQENDRRLAAAKADRLLRQADFMNKFALGVISDANPAQQRALNLAAKYAEDGGKHLTRAAQFENWVKHTPEKVRSISTKYAGQKMAENLAAHTNSTMPKFVGGVLRSAPYVGGLITGVSESIDAAKGEQSWGRAAADTGAALGGGALGGALVGFTLGNAATPLGGVVLGIAGAVGGATFAQDIVAGFSGDGK
ncbi:hypothetical protein HQ32_04489 [Prauserella sp. Am3]|nr:hypothetical protein HQ32_04489 [Prauserella sp. Am3]